MKYVVWSNLIYVWCAVKANDPSLSTALLILAAGSGVYHYYDQKKARLDDIDAKNVNHFGYTKVLNRRKFGRDIDWLGMYLVGMALPLYISGSLILFSISGLIGFVYIHALTQGKREPLMLVTLYFITFISLFSNVSIGCGLIAGGVLLVALLIRSLDEYCPEKDIIESLK